MAVTTILVPLDGSALSERALPYAASLATATGARLVLVTVAHARVFFSDDQARAELAAIAQADRELAVIVERLAAGGVTAVARVPYGTAIDAILNETIVERADLIVMSTHGRGGIDRAVYGSVADQVIHRASVPVLVVPPAAASGWPAGQHRILVALDGSALADAAVGPATDLAAALGATLVLVRAIEPFYYGYGYGTVPIVDVDVDVEEQVRATREDLQARASALRLAGYAVEATTEVGKAADVIAEVAGQSGASLIAMATHGRGGLARLMIGSVATDVLQRANVPVLLVRPDGVSGAGQPGETTTMATG